MRSVIFVYKKKKKPPFVRPCSYIVSNVNMLLSEPAAEQEDRTKSDTRDISVDSAAVQVGSFIHCIMALWIHSLIQLKEG